MQENKLAGMLAEQRERMYERRMYRLLKRVKWGRYTLFAMGMLPLVPVIVAVACNPSAGIKGYDFNIINAVFFFAAFALSAYRPAETFVISAAAYIASCIYQLSTYSNVQVFHFGEDRVNSVITLQLLIACIISLALLFLLLNGAVHAAKLRAMERQYEAGE